MKNIILGSIFILALLPQLSFGANQTTPGSAPAPQINNQSTVCNQKFDALSIAFFTQQGQERAAWIKAHQDIITKSDQQMKAWSDNLNEQRRQDKLAGNNIVRTPPMPSSSDPQLQAFTAKQQSEKQVFFASFYKNRQNCLNSAS